MEKCSIMHGSSAFSFYSGTLKKSKGKIVVTCTVIALTLFLGYSKLVKDGSHNGGPTSHLPTSKY